jgi:hypothetical protein
MAITKHASFLPPEVPNASLDVDSDRPEVVPLILVRLRAGPGYDERPPAKSPSGAAGLSISGRPVRL